MRRWALLVALLLSVGLNVGILATLAVGRLTQPEVEELRRPEELRRHFGGLMERLDLPEETRRPFAEAQRALVREIGEQRLEVERLRRELRRELLAEEPDRQRVEELLAGLAERSAEIERRFAERVLETRALLDPRQERLYLEFLRRMPELRGPGGPPGRGPEEGRDRARRGPSRRGGERPARGAR